MSISGAGDPLHTTASMVLDWMTTLPEPYNALLVAGGLLLIAVGILLLIKREEARDNDY